MNIEPGFNMFLWTIPKTSFCFCSCKISQTAFFSFFGTSFGIETDSNTESYTYTYNKIKAAEESKNGLAGVDQWIRETDSQTSVYMKANGAFKAARPKKNKESKERVRYWKVLFCAKSCLLCFLHKWISYHQG